MKYCPQCQHIYPFTQRFCLEDGTVLLLQDPYHLVGRTLVDKYRIDKLIGMGGMGAVYSAHHLGIDRHVAIKILQPNVAFSNERVMDLFEREAKMAGNLTHENIANIMDAGRTSDGIAYIAMEWIEGQTLEEALSLQGPFNFERIADLLQQITAALEAAHAKRIIHRDLKPANVMLIRRPDGRELVKVLDFGVAKILNETTSSPVSAPMGTPHYASPEQFQMGGRIDGRSDIYSLGVMLYQMLTGALPFETTSVHELIRLQLTAPPPPLRQLRPDAPAELEALLNRLLAKDPHQRPQRAADVLALYEHAVKGSNDNLIENGPSAASLLPTLIDEAPSPGAKRRAPSKTTAVKTEVISIKPTDPDPSLPPIKPRERRGVVWASLVLFVVLMLAVSFYLLFWRGQAIDSVAVLPFSNLSGDANAEYLSDGLTEGLISNLSQLPALRVIAHSSVSRYKGQQPDPQTVGRELKVRAVLVGHVMQREDGLTINLELVDARDSRRLWGGQYDRKLADLLAMQEDISRTISEKLQLRLTGEEQKRLAKRYTENNEAYRLYLKGRYYWNKRNDEGLKQSISYFQQAIDKDPLYALAYSGMADAYFIRAGQDLPPKEAIPLAKGAALQALRIDESLAEAHTSLAAVKFWFEWDWKGAETEFKRALDLNPGYATAHQWYAEYLAVLGRADQSLAEIQRARDLDPLSLPINIDVGVFTYYAGRYDEARAEFQKALEMDATSTQAHRFLGMTHERQKQYKEAIDELSKVVAISGDSSSLAALGYTYAVSNHPAEARQLLSKLQEQARHSYVPPYHIAIIYAGLGEKDQAFAWLEKAYRERADYTLCYLKVEPRFESLRSDPRFQDLLRRVGLNS